MFNGLVRSALLILFVSMAAVPTPRAAPADHGALVERFLNGDDPPLTHYHAVRRLEAPNERFNVDGWIEACTTLAPGGWFEFRVTAEGGSG